MFVTRHCATAVLIPPGCFGGCSVALFFYREKRVRQHVDEMFGSADKQGERTYSKESVRSHQTLLLAGLSVDELELSSPLASPPAFSPSGSVSHF